MRLNTSLSSKALAICLLVGVLTGYLSTSFYAQQDRQLTQNGSASSAAAQKRIALVIGNGAYTSAPPLKNPPNDARDMAASLRTLGFDVTSGINVNQKDMKRLIRDFGLKLKGGGSGLFYYAGHGVQSKGRNYLIPIDAEIQSEAEVEDSGVDASLVLNYMDDAQNGLNIVILDACRNNPFARSFRSANDGLAQVDAPTGTLIAYATAPGRVASDGAGQNGLYTSELLKQMQVPGLTVTDMFMRVRAEVMKQTGSKQVPWEASSLVGSFYFSGAPGESTAATNPARIDPTAFELSYWETIKNSQSADDFKAYLARYPQGQFVELAKNRIAMLPSSTKPVETSAPVTSGGQAEITFWDSIKNSTSADDYRAYLEKYPNGEFAVLARRRLAPLEANEKEKAKADEVARNTKTFKGSYVKTGALNFSNPGQLVVSPNQIKFVYDDVERNRFSDSGELYKPQIFQCSDLDGTKLDGVFIREIRDGNFKMRFEAESASAANDALSAIRYVCANPGKNFSSSSNGTLSNESPAIDPAAKVFNGYYGIMSAGFTARAGKLVVSPGRIQVIWNAGKDGVGELPAKGLADNPPPLELPCASFAQARLDVDFIREISQPREALMDVTGWPGTVARFKASSAADAVAALAAVRESCTSNATRTSNPDSPANSLEGSTWKGDSSGGDKHYEFKFMPNGEVTWNLRWNGDKSYKGTWKQNGNTITMDFRPWWTDPVLITISGSQMNGTWAKGQYRFTLLKVQ